MANPGVGYRTACDLLMEISYHLIEAVVNTLIISIAPSAGYGDTGYGDVGYGDADGYIVGVESTLGMYVGALLVFGWNSPDDEVAEILAINDDNTILVALDNQHAVGETVLAPTFPTQQPTDPFFTQAEMLGYLSRAQNEFLAQCPVYYALAQQNLVYGQIFQNTPANCIEINRVAASQFFSVITSITRAANTVTLATENPHGLQPGSTFFVQNPTAGYGGVVQALTCPTKSSITYSQEGDDGQVLGGSILYFSRLYETTQAEITMNNRNWRNDYVQVPSAFFEDRSGNYRWGVDGKPTSNYPVELLMSVRDTDTLGLLDGFLVPDTLAHIIKYGALAYVFSKDGVQTDPTRSAYCQDRFMRGIAATNRYLNGFGVTAGRGA